jgi:hypothetical protein
MDETKGVRAVYHTYNRYGSYSYILQFANYGKLTERLAFVLYRFIELFYGSIKYLLKQFLGLRMTLGDGME